MTLGHHLHHPLADGVPPAWACAWGEEKDHGVWAAFEVGGVEMRMRWIPPGEFMMGSPEGEPGRELWDAKETLHRVKLTTGFWMFETPCTQALYLEVMGSNPSRFVASDGSLDRPVEQVSWEEAQAFCRRLAERRPDLPVGLPTEAQWEYACRAGTREATYAGVMEILGHRNAPVLDEIAWYGGNSGVEEGEVTKPYDSSDWSDKQYAHVLAATHPVGKKEPNAWGLRDMLGNVWEWCEDAYEEDLGADYAIDPTGVADPAEGSLRVVRGGSWGSSARGVRSAVRDADWPGRQVSNLGFRCLLVPGGQPAKLPASQPSQKEQAEAAEGSGRGGTTKPSGP